eukprot:3285076-Pyramimonas_sp.AAC.1
MTKHSWEVPLHSWEAPAPPIQIDDGDDVCANISAEEAGQHFADFVVSLKQSGGISAKTACVLCYWASLGGCVGLAGRLGYRPDAQSGHFSRHFDTVVGSVDSAFEFYELGVPTFN